MRRGVRGDEHVSKPNGMTRLDGALPAPAAALVDKRLSQMATSVCAHDTRTIAQRRADALVALSEGRTLACNCNRTDCATRVIDESPALPRFVINVIASQETLEGCSDQPGYLEGYGVIDAEQVHQIAESASLRMLFKPAVSDAEALWYQPSAALERWIRCRDLTCRFPGCDRAAWFADIDHTIPFNHVKPSTGRQTVQATPSATADITSSPKPSAQPARIAWKGKRADQRQDDHLDHLATAGEVSFAETHRYGDATAKRCHSPGTPLSW
jgi:hypothetical protein